MVKIEVPQENAPRPPQKALPIIGRLFIKIILLAILTLGVFIYLNQEILREELPLLEQKIARNTSDLGVVMSQGEEQGTFYQELNAEIEKTRKAVSDEIAELQQANAALQKQNQELTAALKKIKDEIGACKSSQKEISIEATETY